MKPISEEFEALVREFQKELFMHSPYRGEPKDVVAHAGMIFSKLVLDAKKRDIAKTEYGLDTVLAYIILDEMQDIARFEGKEPKLDFELKYKDKFIVIKTELGYSIGIPYHYLANTYIREVIYKTLTGELPAGELDLRIVAIANDKFSHYLNWIGYENKARDNFIKDTYVVYHTAVREFQKLYRGRVEDLIELHKMMTDTQTLYQHLKTTYEVIVELAPNLICKSCKELKAQFLKCEERLKKLEEKFNLKNKPFGVSHAFT